MRVDGVLCVQADEWTEGGVVLRGPQLLFLVCLLREWNGCGFVVKEKGSRFVICDSYRYEWSQETGERPNSSVKSRAPKSSFSQLLPMLI